MVQHDLLATPARLGVWAELHEKLFIREFVRSTGQRPPVWIETFAPGGAMRASMFLSAKPSQTTR
jgi:hypothetical protein